jgi:RimJ/RimL family protein N-acetyltransferase
MAKNLVIGQRGRVAEWVAQRVGRHTQWNGDAEAIGLEKDGNLIAGVVFDDYIPRGRISMHCAGEGKRWLNREFLFSCFDYPFRQLAVNVILNSVDASNEASIRFTRHIGFEYLATVPGGAGDTDLMLFILQRENCRWLGDGVQRRTL